MNLDRCPQAIKARNATLADPQLSIGVFARRSLLSPKALRLYDRLGLLSPAQVGAENGYRMYRESQLETARLIAMLRRADMPLASVAQVIAAPEADRAGVVATYWNEVERRHANMREVVRHLQLNLAGKDADYAMYEINQRDVPEQLVLTEQRHITAPELPAWIGEATMRLIDTAYSFTGGDQNGPMFVIYHGEVNEDSDGPVEVCLPVKLTPENRTRAATRIEPAHREAYTRIRKSQVAYPQILSAYEAVEQWLHANGVEIAGPPREVYFADFMAAGPDDEVCDIAFPVV
jgi:DNA-binding transcriptional MerR regulator